MATRMNRGAGDASVTTELLTEINFENVKNGKHGKNGYSKMYPNGYTKYVDGTNCYKRGKPYLNGHTLTSSSDEEYCNLKGKYLNRVTDNKLQKKTKKEHAFKESFEPPSFLTALLTHLGFYILMFLGYLSQALFPPKIAQEKNREGYPPLYDRFASFYSRYVYRRVRDCWNYPICSVPGAEVTLKERVTKDNGWTFE